MTRKLFEMVRYDETKHKDNELNRWGDDGILYALVPIEDQWISSKTPPPLDESTKFDFGYRSKEVMVFIDGGYYLSEYSYLPDKSPNGWIQVNAPSQNITHWMPLPPSPNTDNKL